MSTLMSFINKTLEPRLNDSANVKLWLPRQLMQMKDDSDKPLLPVYTESQDPFLLKGEHGTNLANQFATVWSIMNQAWAEPDREKPLPTLTMSKVTLHGLHNVFIDQVSDNPTISGYDVRIVLQPNYYDDPTQNIPMPLFRFKGRYHIDQSISVTRGENGSELYKSLIEGEGEFDVACSQCVLIAHIGINVGGDGAERVVTVSANSLELTGMGQGEPALSFDDLTLEGSLEQKDVLIRFIKQAINSPDGQAGILGAVKDMINAPPNLKTLGVSLTEHFNNLTNQSFGAISPGGMPTDTAKQQGNTALDVYLYDRLRIAFNQPQSSWYLPKMLADTSDPELEPFTQSSINISDQTLAGLKYTEIRLSNVQIIGLSNAVTPLNTNFLNHSYIAMDVDFGALPEGGRNGQYGGRAGFPPPPPVKIAAAFYLKQNGITPVTLTGSLQSSVFNSQMKLGMQVSGVDVDNLWIDISAVTLSLGTAFVDVVIHLVPRNETLEKIIARLLVLPDVQTQISKGLQEALEKQRPGLSENVSKLARSRIISQVNRMTIMEDNQLVEVMQNMFLTPSSDFYISTILYSADKKSLDPLLVNNMDLGTFDIFGIKFFVEIKNLDVRGLSNTQVRFDNAQKPEIAADGNKVTFGAKQPNNQQGYVRRAEVPAEIEAIGALHIAIDGTPMPPGMIKIIVRGTEKIDGVFSVTEKTAGVVDSVTVSFLELSIHPTLANNNVSITATLDTAFISIINQELNSEKTLKLFIDQLNNEISKPTALSNISDIATQRARQALNELSVNAQSLKSSIQHDVLPYDFNIRLPYSFLNKRIATVFPDIKSELRGSLTSSDLGLTVVWSIWEPPVISGGIKPAIYLTIELTLMKSNGSFNTGIAGYKDTVDFANNSGFYTLTTTGNPEIISNDPFLLSVLENKKLEVARAINAMLSGIKLPSTLPDIFPPMQPIEVRSYPFGSANPTEHVFLSQLTTAKSLSEIIPELTHDDLLKPETYKVDDDHFYIDLNQNLIRTIMNKEFWEPMGKEISEDGATVTLQNFRFAMDGAFLRLEIDMSGYISVDIPLIPDPAWVISFLTPLKIDVEVYVSNDKELRLRHKEYQLPVFKFIEDNFWATGYSYLIPGFESLISSKFVEGLVRGVERAIDGINKPIFKLPSGSQQIGSKVIKLIPDILAIYSEGSPGYHHMVFVGKLNTSVSPA